MFLILVMVCFSTAQSLDRSLMPVPVASDGRNINEQQVAVYDGPPSITDSPGEIIGTTSYENQTNGSSGNRICVDSEGGIHIAWTKGLTEAYYPRYVYYQFRDENTGQWLGETEIDTRDSAGFVTLDLLADGRAVAGYHIVDAYYNPVFARDALRGFGDFETFDLESNEYYRFPYIARDTNGRIHMISHYDYPPFDVVYTYSDDNGENWEAFQVIAQYDLLSFVICSSPVSPRTAIAYTQDDPATDYTDVLYFETLDGENWNWGNPTNVTEFGDGDPYSAWADLDAIYDYADSLHITYQGLYVIDDVMQISGDVMHWSNVTGHTLIATGPEDCNPPSYCACVCKMSLGVDRANNLLYALWSELSIDDVSQAGYSNGELYAAGSADGGASWSYKVNLTNSYTSGCAAGECDSDIWSSMAEVVDDNLHIMYIDDNDAGAAWNSEGVWTLNNVLYMAYPAFPAYCSYIPGDCDHNGTPVELSDVIAMIGMYRGTVAPQYQCSCPPNGYFFAATADPNGNCVAFELGDAVTEIAAYRGTDSASGCADCPGTGR